MTTAALAALSSESGITPAFALAGNVVVALVALTGVVVAQRAAAGRDRDARLWDRRAEAYLDVMAWAVHARETIQRPAQWGLRDDLSDDEVTALEPSQEVKAGVQAFGSAGVRHLFGSAVTSRFMLQHADKTRATADHPSPFAAELRAFDSTLGELHRGIRDELSRGKARRSLPQRWRALRWRWHRLRGRAQRRARVRAARRAHSRNAE